MVDRKDNNDADCGNRIPLYAPLNPLVYTPDPARGQLNGVTRFEGTAFILLGDYETHFDPTLWAASRLPRRLLDRAKRNRTLPEHHKGAIFLFKDTPSRVPTQRFLSKLPERRRLGYVTHTSDRSVIIRCVPRRDT